MTRADGLRPLSEGANSAPDAGAFCPVGRLALRDFAGVRLRCVDLFLLLERNCQNQQQSDQTERGERDESQHQDGHGSLLPCIVRLGELGFGDGGHWAL